MKLTAAILAAAFSFLLGVWLGRQSRKPKFGAHREGYWDDPDVRQLMEYVTLWNDVRPIVLVASEIVDTWHLAQPDRRVAQVVRLAEHVDHYRRFYPGHRSWIEPREDGIEPWRDSWVDGLVTP